MQSSGSRKPSLLPKSSLLPKASLLPKRFPVGTTYVVEGHGDENGQLRVFSRYVVMPGGERINLATEPGGPAVSRHRRSRAQGRPSESRAQASAKALSPGGKKIIAAAGTSRLRGR